MAWHGAPARAAPLCPLHQHALPGPILSYSLDREQFSVRGGHRGGTNKVFSGWKEYRDRQRCEDDVMHFEAGLTPASLAAPAITSQDECPQSPVAPRGPASGC